MRVNIIPSVQNQQKMGSRLLNQLAKRIVLSKLEALSEGILQIIDGDHIYQFGSSDLDTLKATITVRDASFYSFLAFGGSVGSGEAYYKGIWDCDNLTQLVRIFVVNRHVLDNVDRGFNGLTSVFNRFFHWLNANTRYGSRRNISAHYDIGNDLFKLMLDSSMMYSSAVYPEEQSTLEEAAVYKMDRLCQKLQLEEDDHLLEIGTGWGGLAIHAAKNYGCYVTTTTISQQQYEYANQAIKEHGLENKITLLLQDYRDLDGQYDKLVSVEMIEAVGLNNMDTYFNKCSNLLKENGLMCLQAITIEDQRYEQAKREVDFIQKYIFPGGSLPSITAMSNSITKSTNFQIYDIEDIGLHYARTLRDWRERFFKHESHVYKLGYNEAFVRLWEFYLCYCEGAFDGRAISTVHMVLSKLKYRNKMYLKRI